MSEDRAVTTPANDEAPATMGTLVVAVLLYTAARLVLVVAIAAVIFYVAKAVSVDVPLVVAAVFGVLIALPLGMVLFKSLRLRVNDQIARVDAERSARRDDIASRLRGDE
ncbi:DUF4229 domain-containing protein [Gordonia sp. HY285]|uniref:DUF4229 domain-containing protein n=1 Tax=Gordonia liuliyuniae TaxID=2911517 RepID=A0ABS9IVR8_9ACTN|nr:DUF4229 domain-containing protein [Gordonia liuliyuniae]MCF8589668.1 DUF4229 domain-containing protein [Gordonia liuliyuniae]MCF8611989.1 DUF4229 domain-containing protein [Gordonia liuliyuniae]